MVSRHRQLKDAQAAVNEAVANWAAYVRHYMDTERYDPNGPQRRLLDAWDEFDQLRRDLDGDMPHANRDTSVNASLPKRGYTRRQLLDLLVAHYHQFHDGLTCHEMEARTGKTHQNVSPQVNYLETAGWIRNSGRTRLTPSKREAIVWEPTEAALAAVRESNLGGAS